MKMTGILQAIKFLLSLILFNLVCIDAANGQVHNYTVNNGLSINEISCIYQDKGLQYLWVGTPIGLNRFDGHQFVPLHIRRKGPKVSNFINQIAEDGYRRLWLATNRGLACFDYQNNQWLSLPDALTRGAYQHIHAVNDSLLYGICNDTLLYAINTRKQSYQPIRIAGLGRPISISSYQHLLLLSSWGGVFVYNTKSGKLQQQESKLLAKSKYLKVLPGDSAVWAQQQKKLYRIPIGAEGLMLYGLTDFTQLVAGKNPDQLSVSDVGFDGEHYWFCANSHLKRMNKRQLQPAQRVSHPYVQAGTHTLLLDNTNNVWCGTWNSGIYKISHATSPFTNISHYGKDSKGAVPLARAIAAADTQRIYVGSGNAGLLVYEAKNGSFVAQYTHENSTPNGSYQLPGNVINALAFDWKGRLWGGFHKQGVQVINGPDRDKINRRINASVGSTYYRTVNDFELDTANQKMYMVGASTVYVFDEKHLSIKSINLPLKKLSALLKDDNDLFWLGSANGLRVYDSTFSNNKLVAVLQSAGLYNTHIISLHKDAQNTIWIGTYGEGLYRFDPKLGQISKLETPVHIRFEVVYSICSDVGNSSIWLGTNNGLIHYHKSLHSFRRYGVADGLPSNQFGFNAACQLPNGQLVFGGSGGVSSFFPHKLNAHAVDLVQPVFSSFRANKKQRPLYVNNTLQSEIALPFAENSFEFRFFVPNYQTENYSYAYFLEGYSSEYTYCAKNIPVASFSNVPAGKYRLRVKVARPHSGWSQESLSPYIHIAPPGYRSVWAYAVYLVLAMLLFLLSLHLSRQQLQFKNAARIALLEKQQAEEVNKAKLRYFTDIAHEIRTPLTLILGPLNDLLHRRKFDAPMQYTMELMQKSARKLSSLMDELLLFHKSENGKISVELKETNIASLIRETAQLYQNELHIKQLQLKLSPSQGAVCAVVDAEKLEKVISNLLSNAIKFTPPKGTVSVQCELRQNQLHILVADTGRGMSKTDAANVFERFYQAEGTRKQPVGFGIGLALSKRIVEAHGGTISVTSQLQQGSCFRVVIPPLPPNVREPLAPKPADETPTPSSQAWAAHKTDVNGTILLVEDDKDIREYISGIFEAQFTVLSKTNGEEGYEAASNTLPDIIITDYQMPAMDGVSLCDKLKANLRTAHIPVIMLSAFTEIENQLKGFAAGADDYVGKPFDKEILYYKVINRLSTSQQLVKSYQTNSKFDLNKLSTRQDQRFIAQINKAIKEELHNSKLDVSVLAAKMNISRTTLNDKLKAMLGITPAEYIKKEKLKEAYRLLTEEGYNVTEAAFTIGFSYAYFNTVFKKEFGVSPGKV